MVSEAPWSPCWAHRCWLNLVWISLRSWCLQEQPFEGWRFLHEYFYLRYYNSNWIPVLRPLLPPRGFPSWFSVELVEKARARRAIFVSFSKFHGNLGCIKFPNIWNNKRCLSIVFFLLSLESNARMYIERFIHNFFDRFPNFLRDLSATKDRIHKER